MMHHCHHQHKEQASTAPWLHHSWIHHHPLKSHSSDPRQHLEECGGMHTKEEEELREPRYHTHSFLHTNTMQSQTYYIGQATQAAAKNETAMEMDIADVLSNTDGSPVKEVTPPAVTPRATVKEAAAPTARRVMRHRSKEQDKSKEQA
jgi:hypothetical protein